MHVLFNSLYLDSLHGLINVSVRIYLSSCCRTLTQNYLANVYVRDVFSYSHILSVNLNVNAIIIILLFSAIWTMSCYLLSYHTKSIFFFHFFLIIMYSCRRHTCTCQQSSVGFSEWMTSQMLARGSIYFIFAKLKETMFIIWPVWEMEYFL